MSVRRRKIADRVERSLDLLKTVNKRDSRLSKYIKYRNRKVAV